MDWLQFHNKRMHVVGGSSGIGNAIAQACREQGGEASVWGTRKNAGDYAGVTGSDLSGLDYTQVDVSNDAQIQAAPAFDELDVLVLSQGKVMYNRDEFNIAAFRQVVDVNLNSVMACCEHFYGALRRRRGCIIVISSVAAFRSTVGNPAYNASKTGTVGLVRTLAQAWARDGIRVNGLAPGLVDTKMTKVTTENPKRLAQAVNRVPLGRLGTPQDMAGVALFLASPMAAFVTGQTLAVDGGSIL